MRKYAILNYNHIHSLKILNGKLIIEERILLFPSFQTFFPSFQTSFKLYIFCPFVEFRLKCATMSNFSNLGFRITFFLKGEGLNLIQGSNILAVINWHVETTQDAYFLCPDPKIGLLHGNNSAQTIRLNATKKTLSFRFKPSE